ncbi:MAG: type II secretion system F family protein [Armatimonadetes bacterium]|nr:type II secretion system F family protein [Armatimonadota bacterium]
MLDFLEILWMLVRAGALAMLVWWALQVFGPHRPPGPLTARLRRAAGGIAASALGIFLVSWARGEYRLPEQERSLLLLAGASLAPYGVWLAYQALSEAPGARVLSLWFRSLGLALEAGVPPDEALGLLAQDPALERLARFTGFLRSSLAAGGGVTEAFCQAARATPGLRLGPIAARALARGEESGELAEACFAVASYLVARADEPVSRAPAPPSSATPGADDGRLKRGDRQAADPLLVTDDANQYALRLLREIVISRAHRATIIARADAATVTCAVGLETRTFGSSVDPSLGWMPLTPALGQRLARVLLWQAGIPYWRRDVRAGSLSIRVDSRTVPLSLRRSPESDGEWLELELPDLPAADPAGGAPTIEAWERSRVSTPESASAND